jgi:hypothetical protein
LCPIENFGVVPVFTSVTVSFSPGLAVISVMLNFMVSLAVISTGRPSLAGFAVAAELAGARAEVASDGESVVPGAEQPALETARSRENVRYRVI